MSEHFCELLDMEQTPWGKVHYSTEFFFIRGRTDIIASDFAGNLYAFELKIQNWKKALYQAYRNTSFANCSYVILPKYTAEKAIRYIHEFKKRSVGLCFIEDDKIIISCPAIHKTPIMQWLTDKAKIYIYGYNI